jgi:hypothetical protein
MTRMRFVLAIALALTACAELNRPMATPGETMSAPPPAPVDAGAAPVSLDGGSQPGDVQL